ncbi:MAG: hypothetical protein JNK05_32520 [Myxococcales bacterium]|nr:hypothetical protein [Myxococcales bacterium]
MKPSLRSLLLASLVACRGRAAPPDGSVSRGAIADAASRPDVAPPDVRAAEPRSNPVVRCEARGPDVALPALRVDDLSLIARENRAMLVAYQLAHAAHEGMDVPRGDDNSIRSSSWWSSDAVGDGGAAAWRRDSIGAAPRVQDPDEADILFPSSWVSTYQVAALADDAFSRWTFASAWGNMACSPSGSLRGRVGDRLSREVLGDTLSPQIVRAASDGSTSIAAGIFTSNEVGCGTEFTQVDVFRASPRGLARSSLVAPASAATESVDDEGEVTARTPTAVPDTLAIALEARGAAVVLRYNYNEYRLALVGRDGALLQRARRIYRGASATERAPTVGTPTMAFFRGELVLVWPERRTARERFRLRWARWDPFAHRGDAGASTMVPTDLGPTVETHQSEPVIVASSDLLALAWVEGGLSGAAKVMYAVAPSIDALAAAPSVALVDAPAETRSPRLAIEANQLWAAWREGIGAQSRAGSPVRVRSMLCR